MTPDELANDVLQSFTAPPQLRSNLHRFISHVFSEVLSFKEPVLPENPDVVDRALYEEAVQKYKDRSTQLPDIINHVHTRMHSLAQEYLSYFSDGEIQVPISTVMSDAQLSRLLYLFSGSDSLAVLDAASEYVRNVSKESKLSLREVVVRLDTFIEYLLQGTVGFSIPYERRFEHTLIVGGSGHGKTTAFKKLIIDDIERGASVVVIDSQGQLINELASLECVHDRLCLIDPHDVEYPIAINLFDVQIDRINQLGKLEREKLTNGAIELLEYLLGAILGADLTSKQSTLFRFCIRLMLVIPNATIITFLEVMEGKHLQHAKKLPPIARQFFETQYEEREFKATRQQVIRRVWTILENDVLTRMFSSPKTKLNLKDEMDSGKVILINTAKDLLKQSGAQVLGRYFLSSIALAVQERSGKAHDTFIYIDEVADYARGGEENLAVMFEQFRKYRCGITVAAQELDQLGRLQSVLFANTAIKMAGGTSSSDARSLSREMNCEPDDIQHAKKFTFMTSVRGVGTFPITFPVGYLEALPKKEPDFAKMRALYAVTEEHHTEPPQDIEEHTASPLTEEIAPEKD